jgi:hypothetical protein
MFWVQETFTHKVVPVVVADIQNNSHCQAKANNGFVAKHTKTAISYSFHEDRGLQK